MVSDELKREIGQHFVFGFHGHELSQEIKTLIREYHVGNVILMKRNVRDVLQVRQLVYELQAYAKECGHEKPLMIGIDQENGLVSAFSGPEAGTTFPGAMTLAAASGAPSQRQSIVSDIATASGKELKMVGINWAYAPVADVNSDMNNPVIGVRSFGDDPWRVATHVLEYSRALKDAQIAPCAKHFPGHGDTSVDSHLALPQIHKHLAEVAKTELVPFVLLLTDKDAVPTIMTGHMALPELEEELDPLDNSLDIVPASLSRRITTKLLRNKMEFKGVIVTDCLEMDAISQPSKGGCGVAEGSFRALRAGADIVMVCHTFSYHTASVERVWKAFGEGELDLTEHQESLARIRGLKEKFAGSWETVLTQPSLDMGFMNRWNVRKATSQGLAVEAYKQSIALISDEAQVLPLSTYGTFRLYTPQMESLNKAVDDAEGVLRDGSGNVRNTAGSSYLHLAESVQKRLLPDCFDHKVYGPEQPVQIDDEFLGIIFVMRNAHTASWQVRALRKVMLLVSRETPVVIISSCLPYDLASPAGGAELRDRAAHVACFEYTEPALDAACQFIFGEPSRKGKGHVPVTNGNV